MEPASAETTWERYRRWLVAAPELGITVDFSRVGFPPGYLDGMAGRIDAAAAAMRALEAGALANATEQRMVGHYWLRAPELAPSEDIGRAIEREVVAVERFARDVRAGTFRGAGGRIEDVVHVGIGGSALGPQLACAALGHDDARPRVHFLDNADPAGVDRLVHRLERLDRTLVSIVSKSGWTPTPMQVFRELQHAYEGAGLEFGRHVVATTMTGTALHDRAAAERWPACFSMWPWVGGRTSVTSAVGLLPLALLGVDIRAFLHGAALMDELTRPAEAARNPAMLLALAWYWLGDGKGEKDMVVLPYKDRLSLFPRYVQQLVMESVGKKLNRRDELVHQGLTVYGNKGSTDQHAYMQQLRDGPANFFVTFVHVQHDREGPSCEVAPGLTLGDYLFGHLEGTRNALWDRGRASITIGLERLDPRSLGALLALYERAVGLYAELIDVNGYDQPGVDKDAAGEVVALQRTAVAHLQAVSGPRSVDEIAAAIARPGEEETLYKLLGRLAVDPRGGVRRSGGDVFDGGDPPRFEWSGPAGVIRQSP
jgi:glucose-6-phosphate isomerase